MFTIFPSQAIGCYSHLYNLAFKDVIDDYSMVAEKAHALMHKLSYSIPAAMRPKHYSDAAQCANHEVQFYILHAEPICCH